MDSEAIARRIEEVGLYVSSANFPNIFPDGSGDSTAGISAAIATVPENGTAILAPGTYNLSGPLNAGRGNIRLVGYGATLVQNAKAPVVAVSPSWATAVGVTAIALVDEPSSNPGEPATTQVHRITTAGNSDLREGDVFKIVADDVIDDARSQSGDVASRIGEYAVVKRISGTTLYTVGRLRESYATNIRLVAVPKDSFEFRGFTVQTSDVGLSTSGGYGVLIQLAGLFRPIVADVKCPRAGGPVISLQGCYNYLVDSVDIGYAVNNTGTTPNQLGYGVIDQCGTGGIVQNSSMRFVRHAYTDDTPRIAANTKEYVNHGRSYANKIINCHSTGTSGSAFDTHHASESIRFANCSASSGGAGAAGFALRGKAHMVSDCRADWMDIGVMVHTEGEKGGRSWGHVITNVTLVNIVKTALFVTVNPTGHTDVGKRYTSPNAYVDGLVVTNSRWGIDCTNAMLDVRNMRFTSSAGVTGVTYAVVRNKNSDVTVSDAVFDFTLNEAGSIQYCYSSQLTGGQPSMNRLTLRNVGLKQSQSAAVRADRFITGGGQEVTLDDVVFDYPFRIMPGTYEGNSSLKWRCRYDPTIARSDLSSAFHYFEGTVNGALTSVWASEDDNITIQLKPTGAQVLAPFLPGRRRAQRLNIFAVGTGSSTIAHGTATRTRNIGSQPVLLTQDKVVSYFWEGSLWRQLP
ncbi:hypothetical protein [Herbiconiux flava]|uniref:Depolymerase 2 capsule K5-specific C-terminal domain-containing protein n=2 Tax=Herbiconiux flava TaxID=881268 RepID=A0A852SI27_9MICO|nr:hypothetical protein [Herbiconiux flava]NYD68880.1 hypothetical protein [Herbiconiux flava]